MKDLSGWRFEAVYDNGGSMTTYANSAEGAGARVADVAMDGRAVTITLTRILPNGDLAIVPDRSSAPLSWREVFECKMAGEYVIRTAEKAKAAGYAYMVRSGHVYDVSGPFPVETAMKSGDVR